MTKFILFLKTSFIYFIGNISSKLVALLLIPLYTSYLSPDDFGRYDYIMTIISFVSPICFFQIWDSMYRFSFEQYTGDYLSEIITNSYITFGIGCVIYTVLIGISSICLFIDNLFLVYLIGIALALNYLYTYLARVYRNNILFSVSGFFNSLVIGCTTYYLVVNIQLGIKSLYISFLLGAAVQCLIIHFYLKPFKMFSFSFYSPQLINRMLKFSMPLCIASISYWLLSGFTKFSLVLYVGTYENGLYAVVNRLAGVLNTVVLIFQFAWNEIAYLVSSDKNHSTLYSKSIMYLSFFVFFSASFLIIVSQFIFSHFIDATYSMAISYFPLAIMAVSFNAIAGFMNIVFMAEKETSLILWSTFSAAILNCILAVLLTPKYGLYGALVGLSISFAGLLIIRLVFLKKTLHISFSVGSLVGIVFFCVTCILYYWGIKSVYLYGYGATIIGMGCYVKRQEIKGLIHLIRKK